MNLITFLKKYILRRDIFFKIRERIMIIKRRNSKDHISDFKNLLDKSTVNIIFDVGAHLGIDTKVFHDNFKRANIYAFEPFIDSFKMIESDFKNSNRVKPINKAVGANNGSGYLYVSESTNLNSLKFPNERAWGFKENEKVLVESITLDLFCSENNIVKIDILKIDVQGYELEVLKGVENLLKNGKIKIIFIEWQVVPLYKDHFKFFEIAAYLSNYGYDFFNMYNVNEARSGQIRWADAIYISNEIKENMIIEYGNGVGSGW